MITLVGVGHVFQLRKNIQTIISSRMPDLVAVELDEVRFEALVSRQKGHPPSLMFRMLSEFQERLAEMYGSSVGDEMLAAVEAAQEVGADVAFIDIDSRDVFKRVWSELTLRERVWIGLTAVAGMFITKKRVEKELRRFEEHQEEYMQELEERFPTLKRIIIDERDSHMAKELQQRQLIKRNIVAVLGDGHIKGISRRLAEMDVEHEIMRLADLRSGAFLKEVEGERRRPPEDLPPGASVSFSFQVENPQEPQG